MKKIIETINEMIMLSYLAVGAVFAFICGVTTWGWSVLQRPYEMLIVVASIHWFVYFVQYVIRDIINFETEETE